MAKDRNNNIVWTIVGMKIMMTGGAIVKNTFYK